MNRRRLLQAIGVAMAGVARPASTADMPPVTRARWVDPPPPPGGRAASATAIISGGRIAGVIVTDPGFGYTSIPRITFTED